MPRGENTVTSEAAGGWRLSWLPLIILAGCLLGLPVSGVAAEPMRMLLLFGTTDVGIWAQRFSTAFFQHPDIRDSDPPVSISVEYLGLYHETPGGLDTVLQLLDYKQRIDPTDVVIAVQGVAGQFLADHGDTLYAGVPRLYVLPGREVAERLDGQPGTRMLRSAMQEAIPHTLTLMDTVLPRLDEVLVISGIGGLDSVYVDYARSALAEHPLADRVTFVQGLHVEELQARLREASPDSAALLLTYEGDPDGKVYRTADVTPVLTADSAIPVFITYDSLLGFGAIGGVMTSTERYGEEAAAMALDMIAGGSHALADPGPAMRTALDAVVMRRYGVPRAAVPADVEVINDAQPVYLEFLREILAAVAVILLQGLLIVALWRLLRQRNRATRALTGKARDLERQKVLFESVINSIPDAIIITSVDARIVATNHQGFFATFGYRPDALPGQDCSVLTPGRELSQLERVLDQGKPVLEFQGEAARRFPGEWSGTRILTDAGEHLGYVLVVRDVSERLAHEEERRQAHKMEALGSLAGGIAHDFNNILTVMLGNAELILAGADGVEESAEQIMRAGHRARELVGQILAFSRKGSSRQMHPVDVHTLIDESVGFLKASLPACVSLEVDVAEGPMIVSGSDSQLQQVLLNLCGNARDAMGEAGGRLTLRIHPHVVERGTIVSHGILRRGEYVCMEVADTGHGMNAELQQRAFDPFFTTKGPGQGTGMGLALVYGIVQAHEGAIDLSSVPGAGTCFRVYVPAMAQSAIPDRTAEPEAVTGNGEWVLVVEDDESVRAMLDGMLRRLGYAVESYADPRLALDAFAVAPQRFAVVLTDRTMPDMDGLTLCRRIRRLDPTVPLLLCSGYSEAVEADARTLLDPVAFLAKPYRAADLAVVLQRMVARSAGRLGCVRPGDAAAAARAVRH